MRLKITALDTANAREIVTWRYPAPYDIYNLDATNEEDDVKFFTNPDNYYFSIVDEDDGLIGYCCYFAEGQVPGGDYSHEALDLGMGLHPDWTGQGKGTRIAQSVIGFALKQYEPLRLRVTIAAWNERAQKVYLNNGFELVDRFTRPKTYRDYVILVRELL